MITLPAPLQRRLESYAAAAFDVAESMRVDFERPAGAPALFAPDSVSWRVMKNPVALLVGGIAAVILELAEPRVRTGVWAFTRFRDDPVGRMRRTGYAAMVTIYGPAEAARRMIARVNALHARIEGATPAGEAFRADETELLDWVHATAGFGFLEAYCAYVRPLSPAERDAFYAEGRPAAALYGATGAPGSVRAFEAVLARFEPKLEPHPILAEFFSVLAKAPLLPLRFGQAALIEAAIALIPAPLRLKLALPKPGFGASARLAAVKALGRLADDIAIDSVPPAQACRRLGLGSDFLYRTLSPQR